MMKHLSTVLICTCLVLAPQTFCATVQDPFKLIQLLQMTKVNTQTYPIVEIRLRTLKEYVRAHGTANIDKKLKKQTGWTRDFIKEIENDLQSIEISTRQEKKEEGESLSLQNRDVQDLLSAKKVIDTLMDQKITDDSRKEIEGQLIFFENAASRLEKRNQLKEATAFLDIGPSNTIENYTKEIRSTLAIQTTTQPESILEQLKKLDTQFSKIIVHTKNDTITAEQLIAAKHALDAFKELRAQLSEQERIEVQKKLLGDLNIDFYIRGMEKAYALRMSTVPDALSLALGELKKEKAEPKAEQKKGEEDSEPQREASTLNEFRLSYKKQPTKFTNYPKFGRAFLFQVPTIASYADPYTPLDRAALIEYDWDDSMRKVMPQALAQKVQEHMTTEPAIYAAIWLNFKPQIHYNVVTHPVITAWLHPDILTKDQSQLVAKNGAITPEGQKYLFFATQATMGLFPISGIVAKGATIPVDSIGSVSVNPHGESEADVIRFSPDNAYFFMEPKATTASFWTYLALGNHRIIMYNVVINIFNTSIPLMSPKQLEILINDSRSLAQLIKKLSSAETLFPEDSSIHEELQIFLTLGNLQKH